MQLTAAFDTSFRGVASKWDGHATPNLGHQSVKPHVVTASKQAQSSATAGPSTAWGEAAVQTALYRLVRRVWRTPSRSAVCANSVATGSLMKGRCVTIRVLLEAVQTIAATCT